MTKAYNRPEHDVKPALFYYARKEVDEFMNQVCAYKGSTPMDIPMCNHCSLFLETCIPVAGYDGYSFGECAAYLCESCIYSDCIYKQCINL